MARLSRLFSRKDAGSPAPDRTSTKQRRRVAEVTAAPASSPLPPAPQQDVSVTPPHYAANAGQRGSGAVPEPDAVAADTSETARRHHRADLRTPQQADPALRVRRRISYFPMDIRRRPAKLHLRGKHIIAIPSSSCCFCCCRLLRPSGLLICKATLLASAQMYPSNTAWCGRAVTHGRAC